MLVEVLVKISVPRLGPGIALTRPEAVVADRTLATEIICAELRRRRITAVIPERRDQIAVRARHGSRGGRPPTFNAQAHRGRNKVERYFALAK